MWTTGPRTKNSYGFKLFEVLIPAIHFVNVAFLPAGRGGRLLFVVLDGHFMDTSVHSQSHGQ